MFKFLSPFLALAGRSSSPHDFQEFHIKNVVEITHKIDGTCTLRIKKGLNDLEPLLRDVYGKRVPYSEQDNRNSPYGNNAPYPTFTTPTAPPYSEFTTPPYPTISDPNMPPHFQPKSSGKKKKEEESDDEQLFKIKDRRFCFP